jgi:DNA uptake protein ComE-like DNA-binding protein
VGLQDRDYMRNRQNVVRLARRVNWQKRMLTAAAIIAVLSSVIWLMHDARTVISESGPADGLLVVNINTATEKQLQTIPNIGQARAAQIMAGRPYESVDDLVRIVGIGTESIEGLRPFVTIEGDTRKRETKDP